MSTGMVSAARMESFLDGAITKKEDALYFKTLYAYSPLDIPLPAGEIYILTIGNRGITIKN